MNLRKYAAPVEASKKEYAFEVLMFFLSARPNADDWSCDIAALGFCCEFALWRWGDQRGGDGF